MRAAVNLGRRGVLGGLARRLPAAQAVRMRNDGTTLRKPTIKEAEDMPREVFQYPPDVLVLMAENGDWLAAKERVVREIMAVDQVKWEDAQVIFDQINKKNTRGIFLSAMPYRLGICTALVCGFGSFPMVFDLHTALWFNELYVTTEVPPPEDLETWLEVGSWTWNWMEPPLGQLSFVLLCLQYSRAQMDNMNIKPYTQWLKDSRAARLSKEFPNYSAKIIEDFARADFLLNRE